MNIQGIASFPVLFNPKPPKGSNDPRYGVTILLPPNDPQLPMIQAAYDQQVNEVHAGNFPRNGNKCFLPYDEAFQGADYYDPRCTGWYVLITGISAEHGKPAVIDANRHDVLDPGAVFAGQIVNVHVNISGYTKGQGGVGAFLNGVMLSGQEGQLGRLDNKPTAEQMFANVDMNSVVAATAPPVPTAAPTPPPVQAPVAPVPTAIPTAPPVPTAAPTPPPVHQMTAKANGATYEDMTAAGWTDAAMIEQGYMLPPTGVTPSFIQQ